MPPYVSSGGSGPTAIIIDAGFLPHALELILDSAEASHHVLVVLGEPDEKTAKRCADAIRLVRWRDIEAEGQGEQLGPQNPASTSSHLPLQAS